jgi:hypothetical protein
MMHQVNKNENDIDNNEIGQLAKNTEMQSLNESLQLISESDIKKKRLGESKYLISKMKRTENALKTKILNIPENVNSSDHLMPRF